MYRHRTNGIGLLALKIMHRAAYFPSLARVCVLKRLTCLTVTQFSLTPLTYMYNVSRSAGGGFLKPGSGVIRVQTGYAVAQTTSA